MLRTLTYRILSATDGQTILHYLKSLGYSGPILVHLKKTDHGTLLNGVWAHMNETLFIWRRILPAPPFFRSRFPSRSVTRTKIFW